MTTRDPLIDAPDRCGTGTLSGAGEALPGGDGDDRIVGRAVADRLDGGGGDDAILGGGGDDALWGGAGRDRLWGGVGADRLDGGAGRDMLAGGAGADAFVFGAGGGRDRIADWDAGEGDRLLLDDALWDGGRTAREALRAFATWDGGDLILDFGGGDALRIEDAGSLGALAGRIDLV